MKPRQIAALVFIVFGIGFLWMLRNYKLEADAVRATMEAGVDAGTAGSELPK